MDIEELEPGLIVQDGRTVLKVSTIYPTYVTAELVYPVPPRTTVQTYLNLHVETFWKPVSDLFYQRYVEAYSHG